MPISRSLEIAYKTLSPRSIFFEWVFRSVHPIFLSVGIEGHMCCVVYVKRVEPGVISCGPQTIVIFKKE